MASKKERAIEKAFCGLLRSTELGKITVSRICKDAGVSRATFYTYFDGTAALLQEIEERTLEDVLQILSGWSYFGYQTEGENYAAPVYLDICRYCYENKDIFQALFGPYGDQSFIYRYENHIYMDFMHYIKAVGDVKYPELIASSCAGAMIGLCRAWMVDLAFATPEDLALLHTAITSRIIHSSDRFSAVLQPDDGGGSAHPAASPADPEESRWNWRGTAKLFKEKPEP